MRLIASVITTLAIMASFQMGPSPISRRLRINPMSRRYWDFRVRVCSRPGELSNAMGQGDHKSHRGERSNDLIRLPTASCRQCQTSALAFVALLSALFFGSLVILRR